MDDQETHTTNFSEVEKYFRELKSELYMKRNEVSKLKAELEQVNQENHGLRASLDKLKKDSEENQITMDIFLKKSTEFEPKYYEKRDALIKLELQYQIATAKIDVLRESLQSVATQKAQLLRKVDVLEEKQRRDSLYSNEISQKLVHLKSTIGTVTEDLEKLKMEQNTAATLSEKVDLSQETLRKCKELSKLSQKLKEDNAVLEEQSVSYKAKFEKLNEFFSKNSVIQESNLQARVLLTQCKKISAFYKQLMETKNALLTDLNTHLCNEKVANLKLIQESENISDRLKSLEQLATDLQSKLKVYESKENTGLNIESPEVSVVKEEKEDTIIIIEIIEDDL